MSTLPIATSALYWPFPQRAFQLGFPKHLRSIRKGGSLQQKKHMEALRFEPRRASRKISEAERKAERRLTAGLLREALNGHDDDVRDIVDRLTPVLQNRAGRVVQRYGHNINDGRVRQTVRDLVQDVFLELFRDDGRHLRRWDPEEGESLENFVGRLTEWRVLSKLRRDRSNPWTEEPASDEQLDRVSTVPDPERATAGRDLVARMLTRLEGELSRRGRYLFRRLFLDEDPTEEIAHDTGMKLAAIYKWRSRLRRRLRQIHQELVEESS